MKIVFKTCITILCYSLGFVLGGVGFCFAYIGASFVELGNLFHELKSSSDDDLNDDN